MNHNRRSDGVVTTNFQPPATEEEEIEYIDPRPWWHFALPGAVVGVIIGFGLAWWHFAPPQLESYEYRKCVSEYLAEIAPEQMRADYQRDNMFAVADRVCSVYKGVYNDPQSGG